MQDFDYVRVREIDEAVSILSEKNDGVSILCGGTDLLVQLRDRQRQAKLLVDVKDIPDLNELKYDPVSGLVLGAAVSCLRVRTDPQVRRYYPGVVDAVSLIGSIQIQGRASVGGNLCNASPAADTIPALIIHRAVCTIVGPNGRRDMPVEFFCIAPGKNVLEPGELLISLRLPPPPSHFGAHYLRFTPRNEMDIAVAGAGAAVILEKDLRTIRWARLALGAVAATPLLVDIVSEFLVGKEFSDEILEDVALLAQDVAHPIQDVRGTVDQRKHLVGVLARRALDKAIQRAQVKS